MALITSSRIASNRSRTRASHQLSTPTICFHPCQSSHHAQVPPIVPWPVNRRLADERDPAELGMPHDARKGFRADPALADVLVTVRARRECGLRIVGVDHPYILEPHR